jgi:hypothetical protein
MSEFTAHQHGVNVSAGLSGFACGFACGFAWRVHRIRVTLTSGVTELSQA